MLGVVVVMFLNSAAHDIYQVYCMKEYYDGAGYTYKDAIPQTQTKPDLLPIALLSINVRSITQVTYNVCDY